MLRIIVIISVFSRLIADEYDTSIVISWDAVTHLVDIISYTENMENGKKNVNPRKIHWPFGFEMLIRSKS